MIIVVIEMIPTTLAQTHSLHANRVETSIVCTLTTRLSRATEKSSATKGVSLRFKNAQFIFLGLQISSANPRNSLLKEISKY